MSELQRRFEEDMRGSGLDYRQSKCGGYIYASEVTETAFKAYQSGLRSSLTQTEQESVAYMDEEGNVLESETINNLESPSIAASVMDRYKMPLYTTTPPRELERFSDDVQLRKIARALVLSQDWNWISAKELAEDNGQDFFVIDEMQELYEIAIEAQEIIDAMEKKNAR